MLPRAGMRLLAHAEGKFIHTRGRIFCQHERWVKMGESEFLRHLGRPCVEQASASHAKYGRGDVYLLFQRAERDWSESFQTFECLNLRNMTE